MATFEEKILAYLDGSLEGVERDEVLRDVSNSPERRALLDEHVRLQSIYTYAAKPVSAPLALQRELAAQIPVLAIKLPYLAPEQKRRRGAIAGFWSNTTSRINGIKTTWINTILVVLVALLAGGLWYLAKQSSSSSVNTGGSNSNNFSQPNSNTPDNTPNTPPQNVAPSTPNNSHGVAATADSNQAAQHAEKSVANRDVSRLANAVATLHRNIAERGYSAGSVRTSRSHSANRSSVNPQEDLVGLTPQSSELPKALNSNENNGSKSLDVTPPVIAEQPKAETQNITAITTLRNAQAALPSINPPTVIALDNSEQTYSRVRIFVSNVARWRNSGETTLSKNATKPSAFDASNIELGADYEITPWLTAGLMGGDFHFIQWKQTLKAESSHYIDRYIRDYDLENVSAPWVGLDAKYTINPASDLRFAVRAGVGVTFISSQAQTFGDRLLGIGEVSAAYTLSEKFALTGAVQYDMTSLGISTATPPNLSSQTIGIVNAGSPNNGPQKAFGVSLGISFHP